MQVDFKKLCRLCAENITLGVGIFSENNIIKFSEIILKYLSINITEEDTLPIQICDPCMVKMKTFDEYALKCSQTQIKLAELFDKTVSLPEHIIKNELDNSEQIKEEIEEIKSVINGYSDDFSEGEPILSPKSEDVNSNPNTTKIQNSDEEYKPSKTVSKPRGKYKKRNLERKVKRVRKPHTLDYTVLKYECHLCNARFKKWGPLCLHTHEVHTTAPKVVCLCKKVLSARNAVKKHIIKHTSSNKTLCTRCNIYFPMRKDLEKHIFTCWPESDFPYECNHCQKKFNSPISLKRHEKIHLPKEVTHIYPCEQCEKRFRNQHSMKNHMYVVHNSMRPFICDICGLTFKQSGVLNKHKKRHDQSLKCPKCYKLFKSKELLETHLANHWEVFKCPQCPRLLKSKRTLHEHRLFHDRNFKHVCEICNKGYYFKRDLEFHRNIHAGKQPYCCSLCFKSFISPSYLARHKKRVHSAKTKDGVL